ncbi:ketopantoate reductase family protein [Dactylosporangium sucinum]|uniref:2-dehydropantoate 2-reductase n=1 Tax=Dactylosporangium sucinum TaxID=1424081 RepID=A0A917TNF3_9ACTN|nr:2-dehydropantoate 2-reductase [Dactylosporangium sucinum]GGM30174.1 2-dehydropantoate 2-reductase [Dactylosporangium sucinum]
MWSVAILGPGGVGGLLGGVLARAGHRVVVLARPETAQALERDGLTVHSVQFGDFTVPLRTRLSGPPDLTVVATKATALPGALDPVAPGGLILPLLNGVDHMALLRSRFPAEDVVAGSIRVESTRVAPGRIEHTSPFSAIELGSDVVAPARVEALAEVLRGAGFEVTVRPGEAHVLWDKLALLAPMALLTTAARATVGEARTARRADLEAVVREVAAVARASGASTDPARILTVIDGIPAGMKSSMLRDAEAGRPLELDAIGGSVIRAGARLGVPTPVTERVVAQLREPPVTTSA